MPHSVGRLIVICGLPGSGKTTRALQLQNDAGGTRFAPDDWMATLGIDAWNFDLRHRIEDLQFDLTLDILALGGTVIIEWGTWGREERDRLREAAHERGARAELIYCAAPPDELYARVAARDRETPPISRAQIHEWAAIFDIPTAEEQALFDPPLEAQRD